MTIEADNRTATERTPLTLTAGPGIVPLDLGEYFHLVQLQAIGDRWVRLYRTEVALAADTSRPQTETVTVRGVPTLVNTAPSRSEPLYHDLILEAVLPVDDTDILKLHGVLVHTPERPLFAHIEGGPVTFHFYRLEPAGTI